MARLPGLQKHAIWYVCSTWSHAPYNLLIAMVFVPSDHPIGDPHVAHLP